MARLFQEHGAATVVIKMGAQGVYVQSEEGAGYRVPAPRVKVVDSTGAGDAFCAGFVAARLKGWSLLRSARLGNVMGASCCRALGAYAGLPGRQTAKKLLKQWYPA
jgi:sugar/nucleoside kinase (ribokinase family)